MVCCYLTKAALFSYQLYSLFDTNCTVSVCTCCGISKTLCSEHIVLCKDGRVVPSWDMLKQIMNAVLQLMQGFDEFMQQRNARRQDMLTAQSPKYKTSLCRDLQVKGKCPRGNTCSFAHTQEELERLVVFLQCQC
jgi:hypothetical protein